MTNGGKDVFIGHDKRPVSIVPKSEQVLINFRNGQILTDEFGNPLIVEVDTFFLPDASAKRSTSVTLPSEADGFTRVEYDAVGIVTATYGNSNNTIVLQASNTGVNVGDKVSGDHIPDGTIISRKISNTEYRLSENSTLSGSTVTELINIQRRIIVQKKSDPVLKIREQFPTQSEVSSTLLGVNRAETQLSLFSDVSSYGLDNDEFEFFSTTGGTSDSNWETRINQIYGERYRGKLFEETQESGIRIGVFPVAFSFPFGPRLERLGLYNSSFYLNYINFIQLGNDLHEYYNGPAGASYPDSWKRSFLNPGDVFVNPSGFGGNEVEYAAGIIPSFARIDTWTETFRDIIGKSLRDPVTNLEFGFEDVQELILPGTSEKFSTIYPTAGDLRPGYSTTNSIYALLQSRRTFRYQPGRISGFTFGVRASTESKIGYITEWGIGNPTDHYVFRITKGNLSIVRRSTVALGSVALERSGLKLSDQVPQTSGNKFDIDPDTNDLQIYQTIEVPSDNFNGDPLNGNGPSGYNLEPSRVTMWKIEFGWYGAIGARFYAYIPAGNGEARWVVVHTFVIENSLGEPCLEDSYFKLRYSISVSDRQNIREPIFIYKYGSSYYIDGGDEGTTTINSNFSGEKQVRSQNEETLMGISSKSLIFNSLGQGVINKRAIFPIKTSFSSDILSEIKVRQCDGCPGFGHVYTPGLKTGSNGKIVRVSFIGSDKIVGIDTTFHETDRGSKLIAPTLWNTYLEPVDPTGNDDEFDSANIVGYPGTRGLKPTNYQKTSREIAGLGFVYQDAIQNSNVEINFDAEKGEEYPHEVRLSNPNNAVASSIVKLTGSRIDIQFVSPNTKDSFAHFADYIIGVTSIEPDIDSATPTILDGWKVAGVTTSILPDKFILGGTHSHRFSNITPLGVETGEVYGASDPQHDMVIDQRIPELSNPGGGRCALITITIGDPQKIEGVEYITSNPLTSVAGHFLQKTGTFSASINFSGGQVAVSDTYDTGLKVILPVDDEGNPIIYVSEQETYQDGEGNNISFIEISSNITVGGIPSTDICLLIRPLRLVSSVHDVTRIYNYNPYPLYFVAKLGDNAVINNISVKEEIGTFTRTISPVFAVTPNVTVDRYGNLAESDGSPPTNFKEIDRLSSALIDTQNTQQLRPSILKDVFYVGENESKTIDMSTIFGPDRTAITPNLVNTQATFFTAKTFKDGNNQNTSGTIEMGINYGEQ